MKVWVVTVGGVPKLVSADPGYLQQVVTSMERGQEHEPIVVTELDEHPDYEAWL